MIAVSDDGVVAVIDDHILKGHAVLVFVHDVAVGEQDSCFLFYDDFAVVGIK